MKSKTISKIIRSKINNWIESIEDEEVKKLVKGNTIVTGGCIASMLLNEEVNDFDIYFRDRLTASKVANYYISRFQIKNKAGIPVPIFVDDSFSDRIKIVVKSAGVASEQGTDKPYQYFESVTPHDNGAAVHEFVSEIFTNPGDVEDAYDELNDKAQEQEGEPKYRAVFLSTNAITLSHRIQLIMRFYGEPEVIHENFDFIHCTNYWKSWDNELVLKQPALEALLARELRYVGSKYPLCSIMRLRKFIKRGWHINAGQVLKAVMQLQEFNLNDPAVLEDQLTGVDALYFSEVITKLKEKNPERIETAYLVEIIDRIF